MNVGQVCNRQVVSVPTSAPLSDAARLMCDAHVGAIIVTRTPSMRPVAAGVLTDRDIMRAQLDAPAEYHKLRGEAEAEALHRLWLKRSN